MFFNGNTNYKLPILKDHVQAECHKRAVREMHVDHWVSYYPSRKLLKQYQKIWQWRNVSRKITINENRAWVKLFHIAFFLA